MADWYTECTANDVLTVCRPKADLLVKALSQSEDSNYFHGFTADLRVHANSKQVDVFLYAKNDMDLDGFSDDVLRLIGKTIEAAGRDFLEFGVIYLCNVMRPGTCWGSGFRIYTDGSIVWSRVVWPEYKKEE